MHPKLGMEIEANWPLETTLHPELREQLARANAALPPGTVAPSTYVYPNQPLPPVYAGFVAVGGTREDHQRMRHSVSHPYSRFIDKFFEFVDEKFWFPLGWDKGADSGVEGRYAAPANTLKDAEALTRNYAQWLKRFGFNQFSAAGTHVHLGHLAWLDEKFGSDTTDPIRKRAEALMWGYFASREGGIFSVAAPHRVSCGSCPPTFVTRGSVTPTWWDPLRGTSQGLLTFSAATPAWAFHNHIVTNWQECVPGHTAGFGGGAIQNRRKHLPTLEFRFFSGTHAETALVGYLRLLHRMFKNATEVITEENVRAKDETSTTAEVIVNPFTYTSDHMKKEVKSAWLKKWIDLTVANKGEPITDDIKIASFNSTGVTCSA